MRDRGGRPWRSATLPPALVIAAISALTWALVHRTPLVAIRRCISPDQPVAWLGVHLALVHHDPVCPDSGMALGPDPAQGAWLTVLVAAPMLVANAIGVLSAMACWAAVLAALARMAALVGGLWRPPTDPSLALPARRLRVDVRTAPAVVTATVPHPILRRGPPAVQFG
ncbi:MAG: hypothetical protein GXX79_06300 [Actinomycetales bacterium]|nr:hypothetical protein [Actinomycetales bacterium]